MLSPAATHAVPGVRIRTRAAWTVLIGLAGLGSVIVLLIAAFLAAEAAPLIQQVGMGTFLLDTEWWPRDGSYGMGTMVLASLLLTVGAVLFAAPVGWALAVQHTFFLGARGRLLVGKLVEGSASIPTVVFGLWGVGSIVPMVGQWRPPGASLLAGMLVVAVMILPTVTLMMMEAFQATSHSMLQAAESLGVSRTHAVVHLVTPAARSGLLAALILGAARAIGETLVVLMVCGNIPQVPSSVTDPVRTLTANIALEMPYAMGAHRSALFVAGLLILLLVGVLVLLRDALPLMARRRP